MTVANLLRLGTNRLQLRLLVSLSVLTAFMPSSPAMEFTRVGNVVMASGEITHGDADKLVKFLHRNKMDVYNLDTDYEIWLSSPGGDLFEGMALGEAIRKSLYTTVVGSHSICASACALAFLGGAQRAVTRVGIGRVLEPGARLGFHGFSVG